MTDPPQGAQGQSSERATLSRDLSSFLIEFSIALNKHAMYPGGHPSLEPAAERVIGRIEPLLGKKGTLSLGVARQQLIIEGVATDPANPVLKDLAARLHRHHLGAISFRRGLERDELHEALVLVAEEADLTGHPLGLGPAEQLAAWPHVQLHKTGTFTDDDRRVMSRHPAEGANIIITSATDLDLAAVVAYEHHIMINGGGYLSYRFKRKTHRASRLVHVCDVYDALRSDRPYRDAWPPGKVLAYIEERSGHEFEGEAAHAFTRMMREWEPQVTEVEEDEPLPQT